MSEHVLSGASLHGLFTLKDEADWGEFRAALGVYVAHLQEKGFAQSWRLMRHKPMPQFDRGLPPFALYAAIDFPDLAHEQACYDYVARNDEPVRSLHHAMNKHVRPGGAHFFVSYEEP